MLLMFSHIFYSFSIVDNFLLPYACQYQFVHWVVMIKYDVKGVSVGMNVYVPINFHPSVASEPTSYNIVEQALLVSFSIYLDLIR
jgi:hypothetical protein